MRRGLVGLKCDNQRPKEIFFADLLKRESIRIFWKNVPLALEAEDLQFGLLELLKANFRVLKRVFKVSELRRQYWRARSKYRSPQLMILEELFQIVLSLGVEVNLNQIRLLIMLHRHHSQLQSRSFLKEVSV